VILDNLERIITKLLAKNNCHQLPIYPNIKLDCLADLNNFKVYVFPFSVTICPNDQYVAGSYFSFQDSLNLYIIFKYCLDITSLTSDTNNTLTTLTLHTSLAANCHTPRNSRRGDLDPASQLRPPITHAEKGQQCKRDFDFERALHGFS